MFAERTFRRVVVRTIAFLFLGASANLAIAWASVVWSPQRVYISPPIIDDYPAVRVIEGQANFWHSSSGAGWERHSIWGFRMHEGARFHSWGGVPGDGTGMYETISLAGWPMYSFRSEVTCCRDERGNALSGWNLPVHEMLRRGLPMHRWLPERPQRVLWRLWPRSERLPVTPIWSGFALNTLIDSTVLAAMDAVGKTLYRRLHRQARGLEIVPQL